MKRREQIKRTKILMPVVAALAFLAAVPAPVPAQIIFSESFESPVVSSLAVNTVPNNGKWIGATQGYGATSRGLFKEFVPWPGTPAFTTPYGDQGYIIDYTNSGLTTSSNAIPGVLTANVTYTVTFNAAIRAGAGPATCHVELVAFTAADSNAARTECRGNRPGTILATATGSVTTNTMSVRGSLVFTPTGGNTNLGKEIGLRLIKNSGSVTVKTYTVNVTMQLGLTPPPLTQSVLGGALSLSWPASHLGYTLEVQPNGWIGEAWVDVPGSASITSPNLLIDPNLTSIFYRLVYP